VVTLTARATTTTLEQTGFLAGVALAQFFARLFTVVGAILPFVATLAVLALRPRGDAARSAHHASAPPQRTEISCTRAVTRVRTSGSASGRTP